MNPQPERQRLQISSLDGVLAVVPHLLGFHPSSSLVVLGIAGPRGQVQLAFRYDLPDPPDASLSTQIGAHAAAVLDRQHITTALLIGYGPGSLVTPVADLLPSVLSAAGITIRDLLRVQDGRYWSYMCSDPLCCPAEGVPFDAAGHPAAVALGDAGLTAYPDRVSLARTLAPLPGAAASMTAATGRALCRVQELIKEATSLPGGGDALRLVTGAGLDAVQAAISTYRDGGKITDHDQIAWLAVTLADLRVRDDAWARKPSGIASDGRGLPG